MPPAEWLSPKSIDSTNSKRSILDDVNINSRLDLDSDNITTNGDYNVRRLYNRNNNTQNNQHLNNIVRKSNLNFLKFAVDRAISIIKDEHLQKLLEHNQLIDAVRSNQIKISQDERSRRIRDEQVKAISTIKQLTNDLKELTRLELRCKSFDDTQEILDRLDDTRSSLIEATNDFMLANEDINRIPTMQAYTSINQLDQLDESNQYDYCSDARFIDPNSKDGSDNQQIQTQCDEQLVDDIIEHEMFLKLERDTLELRRLFGEFYEAVHKQRDRLDSIETNIITTVEDITVGQQHLQKSNRNFTVIVPLTGCVAGALIGGPLGLVVGGKVGGLTIGCLTTVLGFVTSYGAQKCVSL